MSAPKEQFTERQATGWAEAIADIHSRGVEPSDNPHGFYWVLEWAPESRPERGQDLNALWTDGEHFVQLRVDVFGSWNLGIAEIEWLHGSNDESCECERCIAEDEDAGRELVDVAVMGGVL